MVAGSADSWMADSEGKPFLFHARIDLPALGISPIAVFAHGSRVWGTDDELSDRDHEVIVEDGWDGPEQVEVGGDGDETRQFTIIPLSRWEREAHDCTVLFCECVSLPDDLVANRVVPDGWVPDPERIRRQFSRTSSNSWVKAKKKLTVPGSFAPRIAKKSLWHSLRILMFGTQMLEHGRIADMSVANGLWDEIKAMPDDWDALDARFRPIRNALRSEFRSRDGEMGIVRQARRREQGA